MPFTSRSHSQPFQRYRIGVAAMLCLMLLLPPVATADDYKSLFGYSEKAHKRNPKLFPKWEAMLKQAKRDASKLPKCEPGFFSACIMREMEDKLPELRTLPALDQVKQVNSFINQLRYAKDSSTYGVRDYWAARHETQDNDQGDCEDYSIAKYYTLKRLGFSQDDLRVIAVKDTNINVGHAVLGVRLKGDVYILDNRVKQIIDQDRILHYAPVYSINEEKWWRHRPR